MTAATLTSVSTLPTRNFISSLRLKGAGAPPCALVGLSLAVPLVSGSALDPADDACLGSSRRRVLSPRQTPRDSHGDRRRRLNADLQVSLLSLAVDVQLDGRRGGRVGHRGDREVGSAHEAGDVRVRRVVVRLFNLQDAGEGSVGWLVKNDISVRESLIRLADALNDLQSVASRKGAAAVAETSSVMALSRWVARAAIEADQSNDAPSIAETA